MKRNKNPSSRTPGRMLGLPAVLVLIAVVLLIGGSAVYFGLQVTGVELELTPTPTTFTPPVTETAMPSPTATETLVNKTPWLSVSGRFIQDSQGNNVVLRGVSLMQLPVTYQWRERNAMTLTDMLTDESDGWYARVVRFPVNPDNVESLPGWNADPDAYFNKYLDPAVQNCISRQIYCVIDWHDGGDYNNSEVDTNTRAFWNYIAPKYSNFPNVIYELYNEPVNPNEWTTWKQWAQPWVDIIRSQAPNNLILIGGPRYSQNMSSAATDPFVGKNLVYVAHIYPEQGDQSFWDSSFGDAANSVPFFITEWGWQQGGNPPTNGTLTSFGIPFSTYLESKNLSWVAWCFDHHWQPIMFDMDYNLLGGENYMGQYIKDLLYQHRNDNLPGGDNIVCAVCSSDYAPIFGLDASGSRAQTQYEQKSFFRISSNFATPTPVKAWNCFSFHCSFLYLIISQLCTRFLRFPDACKLALSFTYMLKLCQGGSLEKNEQL